MADIDTTQAGRPPILTRREPTSPTPDELENNEMMLMEINERLGFLKGLVSNINTFLTREEVDDDRLQEENNKLFQSMTDRVMNRREALLKAGASGTAAVYIGDKLEGLEEGIEESMVGDKKGLFGKLKGLLGGAGGLLGGLLGKGARLGGLAAFAALKWDDIAEGFQMIKDGDIWKGIQTVLIGNPDDVNVENAGKGIMKQAGAWAGMGMAIGGPIGAAIGAALGGVAKTVQTAVQVHRQAYDEEWDENVDQVMEDMEQRVKEANTTMEKLRANSANMWQLFGTYTASAQRTAEEYEREGKSKVRGWFEGLGKTFQQLQLKGMTEEEAEMYLKVKEMKRERRDQFWENLGEASESVRSFLFGDRKKIEREMEKKKKEAYAEYEEAYLEALEAFEAGKITEEEFKRAIATAKSIYDTRIQVQEQQKEDALASADENIFGKIKEFFTNIGEKITGWFDKVGMWIKTKFIWPIKDFFNNVGDTFRFFRMLEPKKLMDLILGRGEKTFGQEMQEFKGGMGTARLRETEEYKQFAGTRRRYGQAEGNTLAEFVISQLKKGEYVDKDVVEGLGIKREDYLPMDDFIITKGGKVIQTSPQDTIFGTKAFDDGTMNQILNSSNRSTQTENQMLNVLMQVRDKIGAGGGQVVQNNFTSRFNPGNVMQQGMVEVF
jgi:hypothetical protein